MQPSRPDQSIFSHYDEEYIRYCIELEQTISALESNLHTSDDPTEIAMQTLRVACDFYGGDWAGILEVDLDLDVWTPVWWHNTGLKDRTLQFMHEFETAAFMPSWISSMEHNQPIILPDVTVIRDTLPDEYTVYQRLRVQSVIAVPFAPNPMGFLAVRNPTRYINRPSMMTILAYVLHRAMAQQKAMDSARFTMSPDRIESDKDIIINFFGDMEIITSKGVLRERDFNSPKSSRVVTYLMLNRKTSHPALEIHSALWPEDCTDPDVIGRNIRGCIFRFRRAFEMISDYPLIEATASGYRLNPELNIMTDLQQFDWLADASIHTKSLSQKVDLLKKAVALYRGPLFRNACDEHWVIGNVNYYRLRYISIINDLLSSLASAKDYSCVQQYASASLNIMPGNLHAHCWLIVSMYHIGTIELAQDELNRAKKCLTPDEYDTLVRFLQQRPDIPFRKLSI